MRPVMATKFMRAQISVSGDFSSMVTDKRTDGQTDPLTRCEDAPKNNHMIFERESRDIPTSPNTDQSRAGRKEERKWSVPRY